MPNLEKLSIQNCTGLTLDVDLTMCTSLTEVDATGTTVSVLIPNDSIITKYEVGTPTNISIIRPTALTAAGILVDGYKNITSLGITKSDSQPCNAYEMFVKIMNTYIGGGSMTFGRIINMSTGVEDDSLYNKHFVTGFYPCEEGQSV